MKIGELIIKEGYITLNEGKKATTLTVTNTSARPVQIGSHFHFFEVNKALSFDRSIAYGRRLDIPAGTAVRFQPGESKPVQLIEISGRRYMMGAAGMVNNYLDEKREHLTATKEI